MDRRLVSIINKLHETPSLRLRPPALAKEVGLSERRLEQLFKIQTGLTLVGFSRELRIRLARQMLVETSKPIKRIASEVGYTAVAVFCRDFKRLTGCTARHFRNSFGNGQLISESVNRIFRTTENRAC